MSKLTTAEAEVASRKSAIDQVVQERDGLRKQLAQQQQESTASQSDELKAAQSQVATLTLELAEANGRVASEQALQNETKRLEVELLEAQKAAEEKEAQHVVQIQELTSKQDGLLAQLKTLAEEKQQTTAATAKLATDFSQLQAQYQSLEETRQAELVALAKDSDQPDLSAALAAAQAQAAEQLTMYNAAVAQINKANEQLKAFQDANAQYQQAHATLKSERDALVSQATSLQQQHLAEKETFEQTIADLKAQNSKAETQLSEVEVEVKKLRDDNKSLSVQLEEQQAAESQASEGANVASEALIAERDRAKTQLTALQQHLIDIENRYTEDALKRDDTISFLQKELKEAKEGQEERTDSAARQLDHAERRIEQLETQCMKASSERDRCQRDNEVLQEDNQTLTRNLANLEIVLSGFEAEKEAAIENGQRRITSDLELLKAKNTSLEEDLAEAKQRIQEQAELVRDMGKLQADNNLLNGLVSSSQNESLRLQEELARVKVSTVL